MGEESLPEFILQCDFFAESDAPYPTQRPLKTFIFSIIKCIIPKECAMLSKTNFLRYNSFKHCKLIILICLRSAK